MISAGQLTETLAFYEVRNTVEASGFHHSEEVLRFRTKAERLKNKESYVVNADEIFHLSELTFRLRNRKEVEETDIVEYNGQRYHITSIDRYPRENQMTIILSKINE